MALPERNRDNNNQERRRGWIPPAPPPTKRSALNLSDEKVEVKDTKADNKMNDMEARLRRVEKKLKDYSENWKAFCVKHLGVEANDGKLGFSRPQMIVSAAIALIAVVAWAGTTIVDRKPGPEGAVPWQIRDVTGVGSLECYGANTKDAQLLLGADCTTAGIVDDTHDLLTLKKVASDDSTVLMSGTTTLMTWDTSGNATAAGTLTGSGSGGTLNGVTLTNRTTLATGANILGGTSSYATNLPLYGCTIGAVNPSTVNATTVTASGDITANGNIVGDASTIVTNMATIWATSGFSAAGSAGMSTNITVLSGADGTVTNHFVFTGGILTGYTVGP